MPQAQPELKKVCPFPSLLRRPPDINLPLLQYLDKRLFVQLNGSRKVLGVLRGYDVRPQPSFPFIRAVHARDLNEADYEAHQRANIDEYGLTNAIGISKHCPG